MVQHVIHTDFIDSDMKWRIEKLMKNYRNSWITPNLLMMLELISTLTTWMNLMNRHMGMGKITQLMNLSKQDGIDDAYYNKYIGAEAILEVPG